MKYADGSQDYFSPHVKRLLRTALAINDIELPANKVNRIWWDLIGEHVSTRLHGHVIMLNQKGMDWEVKIAKVKVQVTEIIVREGFGDV